MKKFFTACLFVVALSTLVFSQQIKVIDIASTTAPVSQTRVFGSGYVSILGFSEVASSTDLVMPSVEGALLVQFNTDDEKLYLRVKDSDGASWGADIQMATLD